MQNMRISVTALIGALLVSAGCTAAPAAAPVQSDTEGSYLSLRGKVTLKGNAPFTFLVLTREGDGKQWELQDVPAESAASWQNKNVIVGGTVLQASPSPMLLPGFRVDQIKLRDGDNRSDLFERPAGGRQPSR